MQEASPVFEFVCDALERSSGLDRLEARGTVRIALKASGLDVESVTVGQMEIVLERVLPEELVSRGVDDATSVCLGVAQAIKSERFDVKSDRGDAAANIIGRLRS